jgi:hypothetical protein
MPRAFRASPNHPAVAYLARLHSDLGGQVLEQEKEAKRLADAMRAVESVIRLFDPDYDVRRIAVRRRNRNNRWFKRGTMFRAVLEVLKTAPGPLTVREIVLQILAAQGETAPDLKAIRGLEGGVRACLANKDGRTVARVGEGMPARWSIIS